MGASAEKLRKYSFMAERSDLASHMPETRAMTQESLWGLLEKYRSLILKPDNGSRGRGVIMLVRKRPETYTLQTETQKWRVQGKNQVNALLSRLTDGQDYIVQRRIRLAKINKRVFDMRVIVQRISYIDPWKITAILAKQAGTGFIVTNITRSKGRLLLPSTAIIKSNITNRDPITILTDVRRVALLSVNTLSNLYPRKRIFGLDMGIDRNGRVWVIEANKKPSMSHFKKWKNKTMLRRIRAYKEGLTNPTT